MRACQHPFMFLMSRWKGGGYKGTLRLAVAHAVHCVGCCWALMLVLVAAGAMSIPWMLLISAIIAAEKLVPGRWRVERAVGFALIGLGVVVLARPDISAVLRGPSM